jgi:hypothetical protein
LESRIEAAGRETSSVTAADIGALWTTITGGDVDLAGESESFALIVQEQFAGDSDSLEFGLGA